MTVTISVSGGSTDPGEPTGDLESRVAAVETQLASIRSALGAAADSLGGARGLG